MTDDPRPVKVAPIAGEQINVYGSSYPVHPPVDPPPPVDLVDELTRRDITVTDNDASYFRDEGVWTASVKEQLKSVLDALEERGVRYRVDYAHRDDVSAVALNVVTLELVGP